MSDDDSDEWGYDHSDVNDESMDDTSEVDEEESGADGGPASDPEEDGDDGCTVLPGECFPRMLTTDLLTVQSLTQENARCTMPGNVMLTLRPSKSALRRAN